MAEKRYLIRRRRRFALRFGLDEATRLGFTEDISTEGMFIRTPYIYPQGTTLIVALAFPNTTFITLKGTVMWAKRVSPQMAKRVKKAGLGLKIEYFIEGEEIYNQACARTLSPA